MEWILLILYEKRQSIFYLKRFPLYIQNIVKNDFLLLEVVFPPVNRGIEEITIVDYFNGLSDFKTNFINHYQNNYNYVVYNKLFNADIDLPVFLMDKNRLMYSENTNSNRDAYKR